MIITEKRCTKCGEVKPLIDFPLKKSSPDLHSTWCKICYRAHQRQKYIPKGEPKVRTWEMYRDEQSKSCTRCGQVKDLSEYHLRGDARDGRSSWCMDCVHAHQKSKRQPKFVPQVSTVRRPKPVPKPTKEEIHVEAGMKVCTKCESVKTLKEFHKRSSAMDGLAHWCKDCMQNKAKERRARMKAQVEIQSIAIPEAKTCVRCGEVKPADSFGKDVIKGLSCWCKECMMTRRKETFSNKRHHLKKYGLTLEQYNQIKQDQGGACAICHKIPPPGRQGLVLDHDHATGKFRGLICNTCNSRVGVVEGKRRAKRRSHMPQSAIGPVTDYLNDPPGQRFLRGA